MSKAGENQENTATTESTGVQVVPAGEKQIAPAKPLFPVITGANYAEVMVLAATKDFLTINEGLDLDFVRMGSWLKFDKKGVFYDGDDENTKFGDTIDVVIISGEQRFMLWGDENSSYKGQLIAADRDQDKARAIVDEFLIEHPDAQEHHSSDDVELRYVAYVVPVKTINPEDPPEIYLMSFPKTGTFAFGKYAMNVTKGRYKSIGVPNRSTVKHVVTRITTEDTKSKNDPSVSYLALKFSCLGMFDPKDYNIDIDAVNAELQAQAEAEAEASAE